MCHNDKLNALPEPGAYQVKEADGLKYWSFEPESKPLKEQPTKRVGIITDIYGCNEFYQSFATYIASEGWEVYLIDLFTDLGELKEITREAAFERRHKLRDGEVCDKLERLIASQELSAVIGFCLGGNFVSEMARRNVQTNLVAYYPFPAGLPNQDEIETPLDYLDQVTKKVTFLVGSSDDAAGRDSIAGLVKIAENNQALDVHAYAESGHGFLAQLDSEDETLRRNAQQSLSVCLEAISA